MTQRAYTVACLAGGGIGPEVMAEASRALRATAQMHDFEVEELHVSFGDEALSRLGHPLPAETREAYRRADALLVATRTEPTLEGVRAELELGAEVRRALFASGGDALLVIPLARDLEHWTHERALDLARRRRGKIALVEGSAEQRAALNAAAARLAAEGEEPALGLTVEHLSLNAARIILESEPEHFDVIVAERELGDLLGQAANGVIAAATAELATSGPSLFGPSHSTAMSIAGQGVANPAGILLATAMMLNEGLGERAAARTLYRAVSRALRRGARTADMVKAGVASTTREFTEAVLSELPTARTDTELSMEAQP